MAEILLIGSGNRDKAKELQRLLEGLPYDVRCLADYGAVDEPEETGATYEENAALKAVYYGQHFGLSCVADDSGISVDAIGGAPGVYSARYAGENCTYADNNEKLLGELIGVPDEQRTARFVCCAALYRDGHPIHIERGEVEGCIIHAPRGDRGFGYDPIFVPDGTDKTFAEMSREEKQSFSHRGRAFHKLRSYLESL